MTIDDGYGEPVRIVVHTTLSKGWLSNLVGGKSAEAAPSRAPWKPPAPGEVVGGSAARRRGESGGGRVKAHVRQTATGKAVQVQEHAQGKRRAGSGFHTSRTEAARDGYDKHVSSHPGQVQAEYARATLRNRGTRATIAHERTEKGDTFHVMRKADVKVTVHAHLRHTPTGVVPVAQHQASRHVADAQPQTDARGEPLPEGFWAWAGEKAVVDESGRPIPIFHGSNRDISGGLSSSYGGDNTPHDPNARHAVYVTDNPGSAGFYADRAHGNHREDQASEPRIFRGYLRGDYLEYDDDLIDRDLRDDDDSLREHVEDEGADGAYFPHGGAVNDPGTYMVLYPSDVLLVSEADSHGRSKMEKALYMPDGEPFRLNPAAFLPRKYQRLKGGKADDMKPSDFDEAALEQGTQLETEHTKDRDIAREIAMDHLAEDPDYYTKIATMEKARKPTQGEMEAAGQLGMFGGATQQVPVKAHVRREKSGKVTPVQQHQAKRKRAKPKESAPDKRARLHEESHAAARKKLAEAEDHLERFPANQFFQRQEAKARHDLGLPSLDSPMPPPPVLPPLPVNTGGLARGVRVRITGKYLHGSEGAIEAPYHQDPSRPHWVVKLDNGRSVAVAEADLTVGSAPAPASNVVAFRPREDEPTPKIYLSAQPKGWQVMVGGSPFGPVMSEADARAEYKRAGGEGDPKVWDKEAGAFRAATPPVLASPYSQQDRELRDLRTRYNDLYEKVQGTWAEAFIDHLPKPGTAALDLDYGKREVEEGISQLMGAEASIRAVGIGDYAKDMERRLAEIGKGSEPAHVMDLTEKLANDHGTTSILDAADTHAGARALAQQWGTHKGQVYVVRVERRSESGRDLSSRWEVRADSTEDTRKEARAQAKEAEKHVQTHPLLAGALVDQVERHAAALGGASGTTLHKKAQTLRARISLRKAHDIASGRVEREIRRLIKGGADRESAIETALEREHNGEIRDLVRGLIIHVPSVRARAVLPMHKGWVGDVAQWIVDGATCRFRKADTGMGILTVSGVGSMPYHVIARSLAEARTAAQGVVDALRTGASPPRGVYRMDVA